MAIDKDTKKLIKALEAQGFTVERTRSSHLQVRNAQGRVIAGQGTSPSDRRAWPNFKTQLRRGGFKG